MAENAHPKIIKSAMNYHTLGTNANFCSAEACSYLKAANFAVWVKMVSSELQMQRSHAYHENSRKKSKGRPNPSMNTAERIARLKF